MDDTRGPIFVFADDLGVFGSIREQTWWEILVKHEMLHPLHVPAASGTLCRGGHCASPACIPYPSIDLCSACRTIADFGPPMDLCEECQREVRAAQETAHRHSPDGVEGWDRLAEMDAPVAL